MIQRIHHNEAERISGEVNERIAEIEAKMTINKPGGEINLLNDASGEGYVVLGTTLFMCWTRLGTFRMSVMVRLMLL